MECTNGRIITKRKNIENEKIIYLIYYQNSYKKHIGVLIFKIFYIKIKM